MFKIEGHCNGYKLYGKYDDEQTALISFNDYIELINKEKEGIIQLFEDNVLKRKYEL